MDADISIVSLWAGLTLVAGVLIGAFWADLRRSTRAQALTQAEARVRSLDARSDHFSFGISDLEVRLDSANREIAMLRSDLKVRRATYDQLNDQLRGRWDEAVQCKRTLAAQEEDAIALQSEITNWKDKLDTLYKRMENGAITDRSLKRELASGLSAIFAEAGDALPTVQRLLLQKTIDIGMSSNDDTEGFEEIIKLLSARVELLESQVRYWQDRSTGHAAEAAKDEPAPSNPELDRALLAARASGKLKPDTTNTATQKAKRPIPARVRKQRRKGKASSQG
ncbi:MAG: hypothetical protein AB8B93_10585 [Pseudomonadales bacterium]